MPQEVKTIWRTPNNFKLGEVTSDMEVPKGASLTVPDMATSIKDIIEKWTVDPSLLRKPQYAESEPEFDQQPDYFTPEFDLSDIPMKTLEDEVLNRYRTGQAFENESVKAEARESETKISKDATDEAKKI